MRRALFLFGTLQDSDVEWLIDNGEKEMVESGATIVDEGVEMDSLVVILDGHFSVATKATHNKSIASLYAGDIVGEISFIDSRPPTATVTALRASQVFRIDRARLQHQLETDQSFASRFYRAVAIFLADRLRSTVGKLGYGAAQVDELSDAALESVSFAASRFDRMLKRVQTA